MIHGQSQNVFAGRLSKIADDLEDAVTAGDLGVIGNCVGNLRDLRLTLDAAEGRGDEKVQCQRAVTLTVNGNCGTTCWHRATVGVLSLLEPIRSIILFLTQSMPRQSSWKCAAFSTLRG